MIISLTCYYWTGTCTVQYLCHQVLFLVRSGPSTAICNLVLEFKYVLYCTTTEYRVDTYQVNR